MCVGLETKAILIVNIGAKIRHENIPEFPLIITKTEISRLQTTSAKQRPYIAF
jgi:hypothetical protein